MKIHFPEQAKKVNSQIEKTLSDVSVSLLHKSLNKIIGPRHYSFQSQHNHFVKEWIANELSSYGYDVYLQGKYENVVAISKNISSAMTIVASHYDTVPETPGADDNGSAIVAMLECARIASLYFPEYPLGFISFNCEEDGLLGSYDLVENVETLPFKIGNVHNLEMLGYCSHALNSQRLPAGLPRLGITTGNFIAVIANNSSTNMLQHTLECVKGYASDLPIIGLEAGKTAQRFLHILKRSDHFPFWEIGIPAIMWTDTAEFRNPHYHRKTDTIDTIDFDFLAKVTRAIIATIFEQHCLDFI